jgi:hypothetical protein
MDVRRELATVLRQGDVLNVEDTDAEIVHYQQITVLGSSDDAVQFTLNGLDLTLPGGYVGNFNIESLQVTNVWPGPLSQQFLCGLLVRGFAQRKSLF